MTELTPETAEGWLKTQGVRISGMRFRELGGGVSNRVILADSSDWRAVLKQSMARLRVEEEWLADPGRIYREATAMRWLRGEVRGGFFPKLLMEDRANFIIAMEAAPADCLMWKEVLFARQFNDTHACAAGEMLGSIVAASFRNEEAKELFGDRTAFDELRLDPYYRFTAQRHPQVANYFRRMIARCEDRAVSLVHGDWSPKNLLVSASGMWAIDWEVVHYGDPCFDAGFLLNHLLLKSIAIPNAREQLLHLARVFLKAVGKDWITEGALEHLPALLLARVDGKSPAEYLTPEMRQPARERALAAMSGRQRTLEEMFTA